jgi:FkbM family methyltransferase
MTHILRSFLKTVERRIRIFFEPVSTKIPLKLRHGIAAGLKAKGALTYRNLFIPDTKEEIFLKAVDFTGKTIYDIGGHLGLFSIFFAKAAGNNGAVYTFEPNPYLYRFIIKNKAVNGLTNLFPFNVGIGAETEKRTLMVPLYQVGSGTFSAKIRERQNWETARMYDAQVFRLDNFVCANGIPLPDFVKMDVEGFEYNVLKGMGEIMHECKPEMFIEIHDTGDLGNIYHFLVRHGYSIYHVEAGKQIESETIGEMHGHIFCSR